VVVAPWRDQRRGAAAGRAIDWRCEELPRNADSGRAVDRRRLQIATRIAELSARRDAGW